MSVQNFRLKLLVEGLPQCSFSISWHRGLQIEIRKEGKIEKGNDGKHGGGGGGK